MFSYLILKERTQDRVSGTITKTEDESFEPLILNLLLLDQDAVQEALCAVLGKLLTDGAPFEVVASTATPTGTYMYRDGHQKNICVRLLDGQITTSGNSLVRIPTFLRHQHTAYQTVIGSEYDPLAVRINDTAYQFEWHNDTYCLVDKLLFKKMNDIWYQYQEDDFLPLVLQKSGQFAWISEAGEHVFLMQTNDDHEAIQVGEFKESQLHLRQPKGVFCFDGDARTHILQAFGAFEKPSMIAVVQLEDKPNTYQFELPYYGLSGYFSLERGLMIQDETQDYTVISEETPFDTGIWLAKHPDAPKSERSYLVPIRPFIEMTLIKKKTLLMCITI